MVKATVRPGSIELPDEFKKQIAAAWLKAVEQQAKTGIIDGKVLRSVVTNKKLTLHDTNQMFREVAIEPLKITFMMPYASFVQEKYNFTKLGHIARLKFLKLIAPILKRALKAIRKGSTNAK